LAEGSESSPIIPNLPSVVAKIKSGVIISGAEAGGANAPGANLTICSCRPKVAAGSILSLRRNVKMFEDPYLSDESTIIDNKLTSATTTP